MPGRQGQRPEYQEAGLGVCRPKGLRGDEGAFSAQGTSVLKQPRLCLSPRTHSRSEGLLCTRRNIPRPKHMSYPTTREEERWVKVCTNKEKW